MDGVTPIYDPSLFLISEHRPLLSFVFAVRLVVTHARLLGNQKKRAAWTETIHSDPCAIENTRKSPAHPSLLLSPTLQRLPHFVLFVLVRVSAFNGRDESCWVFCNRNDGRPTTARKKERNGNDWRSETSDGKRKKGGKRRTANGRKYGCARENSKWRG